MLTTVLDATKTGLVSEAGVSKRKPNLCKLCHQRPAAVPDREQPGRRKTVCVECHSARLGEDLRRIAERHRSAEGRP